MFLTSIGLEFSKHYFIALGKPQNTCLNLTWFLIKTAYYLGVNASLQSLTDNNGMKICVAERLVLHLDTHTLGNIKYVRRLDVLDNRVDVWWFMTHKWHFNDLHYSKQEHRTLDIVFSVTNSMSYSILIVICPCSVTNIECKPNIICHSL